MNSPLTSGHDPNVGYLVRVYYKGSVGVYRDGGLVSEAEGEL